ncbi:MAG: enoyl-CoA hydratase/isomerase family protein [Bacteroidota bacterium]
MKIYQHLEFQIQNRIATISLNRPEVQNRLNEFVMIELRDALMSAEENGNVKVVILQGAGPDFCAGLDIAYLEQVMSYNLEQSIAESHILAELFLKMYRSPKIIISQIRGAAWAGGCGLAVVSDFVVASPEATFGFPAVREGRAPAIVMPFLLRKLGEARAKRLLLTGALVSAEQARDLGLVSEVTPEDELEVRVRHLAQEIAARGSVSSLQLTKKMIADVQHFPLETALGFAAKMNAHARLTPDARTGLEALLNQEEPKW